ncbi:coiled-coil domain-containing protein 97-like [Daphnia carinata]|uniref:coiled-coil domain-containing protein 97-like n=1 Tax=Daphnia carinata TaxID=120202 RepID=UPI00257D568C|nr:coiled-coil domain-containing protein 97-like [Daphnia carinata]
MAQHSIDSFSILDRKADTSDGKFEVPSCNPSTSCEDGSSTMGSATEETLPNQASYEFNTSVMLPTLTKCSRINTLSEESKVAQEEIISHVANCSEEVFQRIQHRDEPTLSIQQKKEIVTSLLNSSPSNFLVRFGKFLETSHLNYFHQYHDSYEVSYYLQQLNKESKAQEMSVKNRRFHAMNELIKEGKYFSMNEMRKRNPILFHELIEKYMTSEEKRSLEQDQPKLCNLSTMFMAHIDGDQTCSKRRNEQLANQSAWDEALAHDEEEEDEDIDQNEKEFFRDEFISGMYSSFLQGHDEEFDYSKIDASNHNDIISERDAEERYFDSD